MARVAAGKEMVDGGSNSFVVTVDSAGNWHHKEAQCHHWQGRRPMETWWQWLSNPSTTAASDPGSSVSQRAQACERFPCFTWQLVRMLTRPMGTGPKKGVYDWDGDWTHDWYGDWWWTAPEEQPSEWHEDESAYLVCGVIGSCLQQQEEKVKLVIDSGSQGTACGVQFAKDYETDDSERAKLWDLPDQAHRGALQENCRCAVSRTGPRDSRSCKHQSGCV